MIESAEYMEYAEVNFFHRVSLNVYLMFIYMQWTTHENL
jgi:hypothetical protein